MTRSSQLHADRGNRGLKLLDRYVGIPATAVVGTGLRIAHRGRRAVPPDWSTVGLVLTAGIGDTVIATGVLADLRRARPDARIVLFVTANNAGFARLVDLPDEIVELPVRNPARAVRMVRAQGCDVVVDLGAWPRFDALLAGLSGARCVVGMRTPGQHRHAVYDVVVEHGRDHQIENQRRLVAALGIETGAAPHLVAPPAPGPEAEGPYVVFHPWPGGANLAERSWPATSWSELAAAMGERGYEVVVTGGPEDASASAALATAWSAAGIRARAVAGCPWSESLAWLAGAAGVVSVNTGVMHVAAALGTPTVGLSGPTSTTRWGPVGPRVRSVTSPLVPDGYLNLGFERDDRYQGAMAAITVPAVLAACDELLGLADRDRRAGP